MARIQGSLLTAISEMVSTKLKTLSEVASGEVKKVAGDIKTVLGAQADNPDAVRVVADEAIEKTARSATGYLSRAWDKTVETVIVDTARRHVNDWMPDLIKLGESIDKGQSTTIPQRLAQRMGKFGIPISEGDFMPRTKSGDANAVIGETGRDVVSRIKKEHLQPQYEARAWVKAIDDLHVKHSNLVGADRAVDALSKVFMENGIKLNTNASPRDAVAELTGNIMALGKDASDRGEAIKASAKKLFNTVAAARDIQMSGIDKVHHLGVIDQFQMTTTNILDSIYVYAQKNGLTEVAALAKKTHDTVRGFNYLDARIRMLKDADDRIIAKYSDPENPTGDIATKLRAYRSMVQPENPERMSRPFGTDMFNAGPEVDIEAAKMAGLMDEAGRPLYGEEIFSDAIQLSNTMRLTRRMLFDRANGTFDIRDGLPRTERELREMRIDGGAGNFRDTYLWKGQTFAQPGLENFGDIGHRYTHIKPTPSHRSWVRQTRKGINYGDPVEEQAHFQRMRTDDSLARLDQNRLPYRDENSAYYNEYLNASMRKEGETLLAELQNAATMYDPLNALNKDPHGSLRKSIDLLRKKYDLMFTPTPDPYGKADTGEFNYNIMVRAVSALADANTSIALSPARPVALAFNYFTEAQTTMNFHPAKDVLAAARDGISEYPRYLKDAFRERGVKGGLEAMFSGKSSEKFVEHIIEDINDPVFRDVVNHYFYTRNPDILLSDIYTENKKLLNVLRAFGAMYMHTDIGSRSKALNTAYRHGKSVFDKYMKNPTFEDSMAKARGHIIRELNLHEFGAIDMENLLGKMGNRNEFLKEYAGLCTDYEMFNYSRFNRSYLADRARTMSPVTARMVRFLSWNMYYLDLLKGVARAYQNGNKAPAKAMAINATLWLTAMTAAGGVDNETVQKWANYGVGRTPFLSPVLGLTTQGFSSTYGIVGPSVATLLLPGVKAMNWLTHVTGNTERGYMDFLDKTITESASRQPAVGIFKDLYDIINEE